MGSQKPVAYSLEKNKALTKYMDILVLFYDNDYTLNKKQNQSWYRCALICEFTFTIFFFFFIVHFMFGSVVYFLRGQVSTDKNCVFNK